jgi:hypothetical protein
MEEVDDVSDNSVPVQKYVDCFTCHKPGKVFKADCRCPRFADLRSDGTVFFIPLHAADYFCSVQCLVNWGQ